MNKAVRQHSPNELLFTHRAATSRRMAILGPRESSVYLCLPKIRRETNLAASSRLLERPAGNQKQFPPICNFADYFGCVGPKKGVGS
jgi:hypothetical protein